MTVSETLELILNRERVLVLIALIAATALAWIYLVFTAAAMAHMPVETGNIMAVAQAKPWGTADFALMFLMWVVMMVGMMLPSAAPTVLLFAATCRKSRERDASFAPASAFVFGYLLTWTGFSLVATTIQWGLNEAALLSPTMVSASPLLGGCLLIGAGVYQWTPLKYACLKHCQSPLDFLTTHWRRGTLGAQRMGLEHGVFCVGCCWVLMGLLFVGGVMNLLWIAAIAVFVLLEKLAPFGRLGGRVSGIALALIGLAVLIRG